MFDKDNKFGFIINNNENNNIKDTNLPYTISSKVLATVTASNIKIGDYITINDISFNKDKRYYIEFLGSKKLCSLLISEEMNDCILCSISGYIIQAFNSSTNVGLFINKINEDDTTTVTFTDLVIYEEEVKYLDSKYLENNVVAQNSISLGRIGDIGAGSSAIGVSVTASGVCSHAEGANTKATGMNSHSEGDNTTVSGESSHAEGNNTTASGRSSHAEGNGTVASGTSSHAEGMTTIASGGVSHAEGRNTEASGFFSHAEGDNTIASVDYQHVQGKYNIKDTTKKYAHIVGNGTSNSKRSNAHTLDWQGNAWYAGEVQGTNLPYTVTSKVLATISASNVKLDDEITVNNVSINKDKRYYIEFLGSKKLCSLLIDKTSNAIICGISNYTIQVVNILTDIILSITKTNEDDTTTVTFTDLVIYEEEVKYLDSKYLETDLIIQNSISLGRIGDIGACSSAIGITVEASGNFSHSEGNSTTASGESSHAEGYYTTASGDSSHAEGYYTTASGDYGSHAEGYRTKASSNYQHVQGSCNIEDTANKYAHIVGNGTDDNKANAHTLDWKGNAWYAGKLSQEGTPTENKDLTTKKYVDDKVSSLPQFSFNENGELVVKIGDTTKIFVPKSE